MFSFYGVLNHLPLPSLATIEVASTLQLPQIQILGLPGPSVSEAKERIRSAIQISGLHLPTRKFLINISPSDVRKQGTLFDLGMALSLIFHKPDNLDTPQENAQNAVNLNKKYLVLGELALDGTLKATKQSLRAMHVLLHEKLDGLILPEADRHDLAKVLHLYFKDKSLYQNYELYLAKDLKTAFVSLLAQDSSRWPEVKASEGVTFQNEKKFLPLPKKIPTILKETLRMSASGSHHTLLVGPKGTGKSTAIDIYEQLLPHDLADELREWEMLRELSQDSSSSNFRKLNPTVRPQALLGGFNQGQFRPGELALAHGGALIADEFPEWNRDSRESLRQPLQSQMIYLQRREGVVTYPTRFILFATGNLCPCGGVFRERKFKNETPCSCSQEVRTQYSKRLEGPLLDRIDLRVLLDQGLEMKEYSLNELKEEIGESRKKARLWYGKPAGNLEAWELEDYLDQYPETRIALEEMPYESLRDRHKLLKLALTHMTFGQEPKPPLKKDFTYLEKFRFRPCDSRHSFLV